MNARAALGRYGEDVAARRLTAAGLTILARNWRCRYGEIDIVASDGDALVICEVKARRGGTWQDPMAAVTPRKAERLRRLAERWLAGSKMRPAPSGSTIAAAPTSFICKARCTALTLGNALTWSRTRSHSPWGNSHRQPVSNGL